MSQARYIADFVIQSNNIADGAVTFADVGALYTSNVTENTSLYFTNARATAAVVAGAAANSILFVSSAGVLANSNTLVWTGSNLGIGTGTPTTRLDVAGNAAISGAVTLSGGTANGVLYLNDSKQATTGTALAFDGNALTLGGSAPRLLSNMSGAMSTRFIVQNSTTNGNTRVYLYPNGTGTISAINGVNNSDVAATDYQSFDLAVIGTTDVRLSSSATGAATPLPLTFYTNGSEQMRLTSTGLGIGTSSPARKLQVNSGGAVAARFTRSGGTVANNSLEWFDGTNAWYAGVSGSNFWGVGYNTSGAIDNAAIRLDTSGNLGLGVTPSAWGSSYKGFEVAGAGAGISSNGSNTVRIGTGHYVGASNTSFYTVTGSAVGAYITSLGQHLWYTAPSGTAGNAISFTQAMTLDASGNLGIGTTSPRSKLDVTGGDLYFGASGAGTSIYIGSNATSTGGQIYVDGTFFYLKGIASTTMVFFTANTERARITSAGVLDLATGAGAVGQIKFPATQVASADANTLDDYEEGTWSPTLSPSTNIASMSFSDCRYTKIGNIVICAGNIVGTTSAAGTVSFTMTGPFPMIAASNVGNLGVISAYPYAGTYKQTGYVIDNSGSEGSSMYAECYVSAAATITFRIQLAYQTA
jgi:hypothetical protein